MSKKSQQDKNFDSTKFIARFGCGFLVGILIAGGVGILSGAQTISNLIAVWIIFAVVCGLLAAIFGDKFWHTIIHWF